MIGLYIHIPFCKSRCIYCDFYSNKSREVDSRYVDCIINELRLRLSEVNNDMISTIYIGGGTPSMLSIADLNKLFDGIYHLVKVKSDAEITLEANPDDISYEYAQLISSLPINRVSLGVQSFNDNLLHFCLRRHTSTKAVEAVRTLQSVGINNISIDLIYGIPGQNIEIFKNDISIAMSLNIQHISAYSLSYEEGTKLTTMRNSGIVLECDEDTSIEMYKTLISELRKYGYIQYEISNFALPGYESKHNSSYWQSVPYIGLGPGAHSFDGNSRYNNDVTTDIYIDSLSSNKCCYSKSELSEIDKYNELILTRLRTRNGLDINELTNYSAEIQSVFNKTLDSHLQSNTMALINGMAFIKEENIFITDAIIEDFFIV